MPPYKDSEGKIAIERARRGGGESATERNANQTAQKASQDARTADKKPAAGEKGDKK